MVQRFPRGSLLLLRDSRTTLCLDRSKSSMIYLHPDAMSSATRLCVSLIVDCASVELLGEAQRLKALRCVIYAIRLCRALQPRPYRNVGHTCLWHEIGHQHGTGDYGAAMVALWRMGPSSSGLMCALPVKAVVPTALDSDTSKISRRTTALIPATLWCPNDQEMVTFLTGAI
jgi:hypothetical protein